MNEKEYKAELDLSAKVTNLINVAKGTNYDNSSIINQTITGVDISTYDNNDAVILYFENGHYFTMYHDRDCCESVELIDEDNDNYQSLRDLVGAKLLNIEAVSNEHETSEYTRELWTFYNLVTTKDIVQLRWFGSSNGYYSEEIYDKVGYCEPFLMNVISQFGSDRFQIEITGLNRGLDECVKIIKELEMNEFNKATTIRLISLLINNLKKEGAVHKLAIRVERKEVDRYILTFRTNLEIESLFKPNSLDFNFVKSNDEPNNQVTLSGNQFLIALRNLMNEGIQKNVVTNALCDRYLTYLNAYLNY